MSSIVLTGDTSGTITVSAPAVAGTRTLTLPAATGTAILEDASGVLQMNSGYGSNAAAYGCRAWVNFNGTGTVAIRDSGNVSSVTDNGTGDYTVNFTNAMPDANYSVGGMGMRAAASGSGSAGVYVCAFGSSTYADAFLTSSLRVHTKADNGGMTDLISVSVAIFR
mgnify:CR=1 FL=1